MSGFRVLQWSNGESICEWRQSVAKCYTCVRKNTLSGLGESFETIPGWRGLGV